MRMMEVRQPTAAGAQGDCGSEGVSAASAAGDVEVWSAGAASVREGDGCWCEKGYAAKGTDDGVEAVAAALAREVVLDDGYDDTGWAADVEVVGMVRRGKQQAQPAVAAAAVRW